MERVKIDWFSMKELAEKKIDEMNRLFTGTGLKAKLFTKTVGEGHLQCEEYAIVIYKEKADVQNTSAKNIVHRHYKKFQEELQYENS
jgi:hypothetical protein